MNDATAGSSGKQDLVGQILEGRYRVERLLGRGGMGSVYLAEDARMRRRVVVKVPHARFLEEEGFRERFEREIESLTRLPHPHIVKALDAGSLARPGGADPIPYAILEFLAGGSLKDRLVAAGGREAPVEVAAWLLPVAQALDFIHGENVVHRDVKPGNVLFDTKGNVFLADFGIAKALGSRDTGLTQTGMTPGSPDYMAPEAAMGSAVGPAYDQYALAVVVYEALSGRLPHAADTPVAILVKKQTEEPPPLSSTAPNVPGAAAATVMRGLAKDPAQRFPSCRSFAEAFSAGLAAPAPGLVADSGDVSQTRQAPTPALRAGSPRANLAPAEPARSKGGRRLVVWLLAAVVVGAGAFAVLTVAGSREGGGAREVGDSLPPGPPSTPTPSVETPAPPPPSSPTPPAPPAPPAWEKALKAASSAAGSEDWPEAQRQMRLAAEAGMPKEAIPSVLERGLAAYAAPPTLELEAPATGTVITTPEVRVAGVLTTERAADRVFLNGEAAPLTDRRFEYVLRFDGADTARLEVVVRDGAAERLALAPRTYRYVRPIPLLLASLASADEAARRKASEDFVRLGSAATPAVGRILELTASPDTAVAATAVTTLGGLGASIAPQLLAAMRERSADGVDRGAFRALVAMGAPAVPALIEAFQGEPDRPGATMFTSPMMALGQIGAPAVPLLLEAMRGTDGKNVKRIFYAVEAMARVLEGNPNAAGENQAKLVTQLLQCLTTVRKFEGSSPRFYVLSCLGVIGAGSEAAVDAVAAIVSEATPALVLGRGDEDLSLRVDASAAIGALASMGSAAAKALPVLRELERRLRVRGDADDLVEAVYAIGAITGDYKAYVDALVGMLDRPQQHVRLGAIQRLAGLGTKGALAAPKLRAMLDRKEAWATGGGERDWYTYAEAAVAYWKITLDNPDLVARLSEVLKNVSPDGGGVRWALALAEAYQGTPPALAYLDKALKAPDLSPQAKKQVEEALEKLRPR